MIITYIFKIYVVFNVRERAKIIDIHDDNNNNKKKLTTLNEEKLNKQIPNICVFCLSIVWILLNRVLKIKKRNEIKNK